MRYTLQKMSHSRSKLFFVLFILVLLIGCQRQSFDETRAFDYIATQVAFGPRIPGSKISREFQKYLSDELFDLGWSVEHQMFIFQDTSLTNIIARNSDQAPDILLGTHYDTRSISDRDSNPSFQMTPVPGANDGGSGTAILMELAHHLVEVDKNIWLVFFDAEDQGRINNWDWSIGAQFFVDNLEKSPQKTIIIDMVGDSDLNIFIENNSSQTLVHEIWRTAKINGYEEYFIPESKYSIMDDHVPFLAKGIPAVLIIDLDYPHWHTTNDNLEHISKDSLNIVGSTILDYVTH